MQLRLPAQCKQKREALRCQFWEMSRGMDPKRGQHEEDYDNDKPLDSGDSGDSPNQSLPPQQGEFYPDGMKTSGLGMEKIHRSSHSEISGSLWQVALMPLGDAAERHEGAEAGRAPLCDRQ